jgi:hypothetical protein
MHRHSLTPSLFPSQNQTFAKAAVAMASNAQTTKASREYGCFIGLSSTPQDLWTYGKVQDTSN